VPSADSPNGRLARARSYPALRGRSPGAAGLRYHELHRLGRTGWVRTALGILGLVAALMVFAPVLLTGSYLALGEPFGDASIDPLTPPGLVLVCLSLAVAVPVAIGVTRIAHALSGRWLMSVAATLRWRWLLACAGLAAVSLFAALAVSLALPEQGGSAVEGAANEMTDQTLAFALIVLLLIPLQAAGEEYAFRGYLAQAFGGLLRGRAGVAVAVAVPALLFAIAHGAQDAPVFIDRFAFGLVAGALAIVTGGLEAAIAMHVLNNWAFFSLALAFGDITEALAPLAGTWWILPGTLTQSLAYLGLVAWLVRRRGLETTVVPGVLEPPRGRV
jgi:membrane protease YdiL (CAAX protease family)